MKIINYIFAWLMMILIVASIARIGAKLDQTTEQVKALDTRIDEVENVDYLQKKDIEPLREDIKALEDKLSKVSRGVDRSTKRIMEVTAYWEGSCSKAPSHPEYRVTASGEMVKEWYTIAAGPELPFGTQVYIPYFRDKPNKGVFVVQDRGSMILDGCLDIYMSTYKDCMDFGRQRLEVYVLE